MLKTSVDLNDTLFINPVVLLSHLDIGECVYLSVKDDFYCDLLSVTKISEDSFELIPHWLDSSDKTNLIYSKKEFHSDNYYLIHDIKFNETILNSALKDDCFELVKDSNLTLENLYLYMVEENHVLDSKYRSDLSLETYKIKRMYDTGNFDYV